MSRDRCWTFWLFLSQIDQLLFWEEREINKLGKEKQAREVEEEEEKEEVTDPGVDTGCKGDGGNRLTDVTKHGSI